MTQYEKNPNGGYLNKSNYGEDSWYGAVSITPELLSQVRATGKVLIEVKDIQTTQYGQCRRTVAKAYVPKQPTQEAPAQQANLTPAPNTQQGQGYPQAPQPISTPQQQPQAQATQTLQEDNIPF